MITGLPNKALHQTRRGGAAASRPVVEARLAGEGRCWTGTWAVGEFQRRLSRDHDDGLQPSWSNQIGPNQQPVPRPR